MTHFSVWCALFRAWAVEHPIQFCPPYLDVPLMPRWPLGDSSGGDQSANSQRSMGDEQRRAKWRTRPGAGWFSAKKSAEAEFRASL